MTERCERCGTDLDVIKGLCLDCWMIRYDEIDAENARKEREKKMEASL